MFHPIANIILFLIIVLLPGAWLTFGMQLPGFSFENRLLVGAVLSPLVIGIQFYILRILGVSFDYTAILLVLINLPVILIILKRREKISLPAPLVIAGVFLVLLVPLALMAPQLINSQARAFTGHAWMHSDYSYMIANGQLIPEHPELAGLKLKYPWTGYIFQAVLSDLLGSPPAVSYIWTNIFYLLIIYRFAPANAAAAGYNNG